MKKFFIVQVLLILFLSACGQGDSDGNCNDGICVKFTVEGPIQTEIPIPYTIMVWAIEEIEEIHLTTRKNELGEVTMTFEQVPVGAKLAYSSDRDTTITSWQLPAKAGEEYIFRGQLTFPKPDAIYPLTHWTIYASASRAHSTRSAFDSFDVYFNAEGNQMDEKMGKQLLEETIPILPTIDPSHIAPTETPIPTVDWPTDTPIPSETPVPSPTPTLPPYPA